MHKHKHKQRILIAGCGDVGSALGLELIAAGHFVQGLRRTINQLPPGIHGIAADLTNPASLSGRLPACDILVYSAAASRHDEAGYRAAYIDGLRNLLAALPQPPRRLFFTSSSGGCALSTWHPWIETFLTVPVYVASPKEYVIVPETGTRSSLRSVGTMAASQAGRTSVKIPHLSYRAVPRRGGRTARTWAGAGLPGALSTRGRGPRRRRRD